MKQNYCKEKEIYDTADYNIFTETLYKSAIEDFKQPINKSLCFNFVLTDIRNGIQILVKPLAIQYQGLFMLDV